MDLDLDLEELKEKQSRADLMKGALGAMGGALQSQANVPSAYEYLHGKVGQPTDFKGTFDGIAGNIKDPMETERKAMEYMKQRREQRVGADQDAQLSSLKDPNSVQSKARKALAEKYGVPTTPEMSGYDVDQLMDSKKMFEREAGAATDFKNAVELEKVRQKGDMQKLGVQKQIEASAKAAELERERKKAELNLENIPLEDRKIVTGLAEKNANFMGMANDIETAVASWDGMDEKAKLQNMRELIKGLNSKYGADAAGAEEVKRLASKLEFAYGNFTNGNPTQFGRDLKGFATDAVNTAKNMRATAQKNAQDMARIKGGQSQALVSAPPPPPMDRQARAAEILKKREQKKQTAGN